ncbi:tRNA (adenosine(37)-N6)-threonylcarbamoyltransferase complex ATPase subunit type 1 TsaE [Thiobacter aerophilum]|uniref:tRNA threonylcarbamoyladenosine biosynthesis protein TsaE n=1 Tax=Thiobacter aerophilum TaxID=3121275 RepID=A0ABV0EHZ5_9BURK
MTQELSRFLPDEHATVALGAALAQGLQPGMVLNLHGELGAGKTTLVRGMLRGLDYTGRVKSPTYTLVELYTLSKLSLYHFDFYRFADPREWVDAGFREAFGGEAVCLVEWPEKAGGALPPPDLDIHLSFQGEGRKARLVAHTEAGKACLERLARGRESDT